MIPITTIREIFFFFFFTWIYPRVIQSLSAISMFQFSIIF